MNDSCMPKANIDGNKFNEKRRKIRYQLQKSVIRHRLTIMFAFLTCRVCVRRLSMVICIPVTMWCLTIRFVTFLLFSHLCNANLKDLKWPVCLVQPTLSSVVLAINFRCFLFLWLFVICGFSLLVLRFSALRVFFAPGSAIFPSHQKPTFDLIFLIQFDLHSLQLVKPLGSAKSIELK